VTLRDTGVGGDPDGGSSKNGDATPFATPEDSAEVSQVREGSRRSSISGHSSTPLSRQLGATGVDKRENGSKIPLARELLTDATPTTTATTEGGKAAPKREYILVTRENLEGYLRELADEPARSNPGGRYETLSAAAQVRYWQERDAGCSHYDALGRAIAYEDGDYEAAGEL